MRNGLPEGAPGMVPGLDDEAIGAYLLALDVRMRANLDTIERTLGIGRTIHSFGAMPSGGARPPLPEAVVAELLRSRSAPVPKAEPKPPAPRPVRAASPSIAVARPISADTPEPPAPSPVPPPVEPEAEPVTASPGPEAFSGAVTPQARPIAPKGTRRRLGPGNKHYQPPAPKPPTQSTELAQVAPPVEKKPLLVPPFAKGRPGEDVTPPLAAPLDEIRSGDEGRFTPPGNSVAATVSAIPGIKSSPPANVGKAPAKDNAKPGFEIDSNVEKNLIEHIGRLLNNSYNGQIEHQELMENGEMRAFLRDVHDLDKKAVLKWLINRDDLSWINDGRGNMMMKTGS